MQDRHLTGLTLSSRDIVPVMLSSTLPPSGVLKSVLIAVVTPRHPHACMIFRSRWCSTGPISREKVTLPLPAIQISARGTPASARQAPSASS